MPYRYAVQIIEQPKTRVIENDVEIALANVGYQYHEMDVEEIEEGALFILILDRALRGRQGTFQRELEWLDGTESCTVKIEDLGIW